MRTPCDALSTVRGAKTTPNSGNSGGDTPCGSAEVWLVTCLRGLEHSPRTELHEKAVDLLPCSSERECFALGIHSKGIVGEGGQVKAYGPRAIVPMVALAEDVNAITPIRCLTTSPSRAVNVLRFAARREPKGAPGRSRRPFALSESRDYHRPLR